MASFAKARSGGVGRGLKKPESSKWRRVKNQPFFNGLPGASSREGSKATRPKTPIFV